MDSRQSRKSGFVPVTTSLLSLLVFEFLRRRPDLDLSVVTPVEHFYIVTIAAFLAGTVASAIGWAGRRQGNLQVTSLALAFTSLGFLLTLHGLATPGLLLPETRVPAAASQLGILLMSVWILVSATASDSPTSSFLIKYHGWLLPIWLGLLTVLVFSGLINPEVWSVIPIYSPPLRWIAAGAVMLMFGISGLRYWQSYTYTHFPLQRALVFVCGWLAVTQWIMANSTMWRLSWWLYHVLIVAAMVALLVGITKQFSQRTSIGSAVRGLFLTHPRDLLEAGLSDSVRALIIATEARDPYTAGHSYRVTMNALRLAQRLNLSGDALRSLVQGGLVHDTGKIEIPDSILNKPDRLTSQERITVEKHPMTGYNMCLRLGFMPEALAVIRSHHERWDGTGYPDRLQSDEIPLLARVVAVADVYDALTSQRAYRDSWSHERAMTYIVQGSGTQFDPKCVEAWEHIVSGEIAHAWANASVWKEHATNPG